MIIRPPPPQNRRKKGGKADTVSHSKHTDTAETTPSPIENTATSDTAEISPIAIAIAIPTATATTPIEDPIATSDSESYSPSPPQLTVEEAVEKVSAAPYSGLGLGQGTEQIFCPECYLPLHPDPKPEKLYIFLHALKYTISLGEFSTEMPDWAAEGWEWDQT